MEKTDYQIAWEFCEKEWNDTFHFDRIVPATVPIVNGYSAFQPVADENEDEDDDAPVPMIGLPFIIIVKNGIAEHASLQETAIALGWD